MLLRCYIFLMLAQGQVRGVLSIIGEPPSLKLEALDCKTNKISYSRADEFCSKQQENSVHKPLQRITLAEHVDQQTVKAIRCTKTVSESVHMCGAYSHMKLLAPPKYTMVTEITPHECKSMHDTGIYRDGDTYPLTVNTALHYQKIARGKLTLTTDNVFCDGEQIWVGNILHDQGVQFLDIIVNIQEVEMELNYESRTASDLTNRRELDESCFGSRMCISNNESYVKLDEINMCRLRKIRDLKVEEITVDTDKGKSNLVVDHQDKIAIEKRSPLVPSLECEKNVGKYYGTNIDDLVIIYDRDLRKEKLERVRAEGVSVRSQEVASSTYLSLTSVLKLETMHSMTNNKICSTVANLVENIERSPFMPNAILKREGDLILQIKCKETEVSVNLGDKADFCIEGYLPVLHNGKEVLLSAISHIIYDENDQTSFPNIDCKKAPYFVTKDGQVIQQRPQIEIVNITLTKLGTFLDESTGNEINEVDIFNNDGLYTSEQFHQFEDLIHWGRKRKMLQNMVIDSYCKEGNCLGTDRYNFQKYGTNPGGMVKSVMEWIRITFWDKLQMVGSYTSVLVVFLYTCQLIRCMYNKMDDLVHLRFLFKRKRDNRHSSINSGVEGSFTHEIARSEQEPEIMVMTEFPTEKMDTQKCNCHFCRGVKHSEKMYWPRNTCGRSCCLYHLKGRCEPYEWCLLDPQNLAFDHRDEDRKHKSSVTNTVSLRSVCKCVLCLGTYTHPDWKYYTNGCGCQRCENCNSAEIEYRKSLGIEYNMIFVRKNLEAGNHPPLE